MGLSAGINTFSYARNNSLDLYDPQGLKIYGRWVGSPSLTYGDVTLKWPLIEFELDAKPLPPAISFISTVWQLEGRVEGNIYCWEDDPCEGFIKSWSISPFIQFQQTITVPVWLTPLPPQIAIPIAIGVAIYDAYSAYDEYVARAIADIYKMSPERLCKKNQ